MAGEASYSPAFGSSLSATQLHNPLDRRETMPANRPYTLQERMRRERSSQLQQAKRSRRPKSQAERDEIQRKQRAWGWKTGAYARMLRKKDEQAAQLQQAAASRRPKWPPPHLARRWQMDKDRAAQAQQAERMRSASLSRELSETARRRGSWG